MLAIFKREFKSYFQNVIGWLFVAALLAVYGLYFYVYNLKNGYPYISYDLKGIGFIMMIAVPILTMRSLSDEKKTKTDQLMRMWLCLATGFTVYHASPWDFLYRPYLRV